MHAQGPFLTKEGLSSANATPSGRGALRPRARLLRTLGNDLISSDKVALIELVKNSYDADASKVLIRFLGPLDEGKGQIEVWDDGHGMDVDTLQSVWLEIATDTKKKNPRSEGGRRVLGEKGIGRLAGARLGEEMLLVTRRSGATEVQLLIDWTQFDRDDAYLDEIEVAWDVGEARYFSDAGDASSAFSSSSIEAWQRGRGTLLRIFKLRHAWSRKDLEELRTALSRLIRPIPSLVKPTAGGKAAALQDFQIFVALSDVKEEFQNLAGPVESSINLRTPHYRLSGLVDAAGSAILHYSQAVPPKEEEIGVKNLWQKSKTPPQAGPFEFEIDVWDRDSEAIQRTLELGDLKKTTPNSKDLKGFRDTLDEVSGVSIYRDGFRVLPFGERGDDWLGLDLRRVQSPTRRLSNNQIIGHIFIGADTNEELRDQSNREGFLEGTAYADMQTLTRAALSELETRRYIARHPANAPTPTKRGIFDKFDLEEIRDVLTTSYPADVRLLGLVDEKDRDIQEGLTEMKTVLSRYSRLATLGSLIDRVLHDGRTVVTRLKNTARFGKRDLEKSALSNEEKLHIADGAMTQTANQAELLASLFNQIEPFGGRKQGRPKDLAIREILQKAISILQVEADERGVRLETEGENFTVRLDEAEVLTVLVNLVQNAIYWAAEGSKASDKRVLIGARRNPDNSVALVVSDSGPGVPDELRDLIFDPYFSSRPEGVGLGLSIVGNLVEDVYGGEFLLVDEGPLSGATFEATFRKRV